MSDASERIADFIMDNEVELFEEFLEDKASDKVMDLITEAALKDKKVDQAFREWAFTEVCERFAGEGERELEDR